MNKPLLGLTLGAVLGAIDGASAYFYPDVREYGMITGIVIGSMGKGLVAGLVTGFIARKLRNVPLGILSGLLVFAAITYPIAIMENPDTHKVYFWEIILPGSLCGAIVGYATQRYGSTPNRQAMARAR
ncbi:MAG: hypothetical protein IPK67_05625 [Planctomycetes bacterium]|nr:hypothetical protein [Planctomycetota bacterium]